MSNHRSLTSPTDLEVYALGYGFDLTQVFITQRLDGLYDAEIWLDEDLILRCGKCTGLEVMTFIQDAAAMRP
jgi:hypothetical protein